VACGSDDVTGIETAVVGVGSVSELVEAPASVTARSTVTITSPASGTVATLKVADGSAVKKNTVLLVIDSPQAEQNLEAAQDAQSSASVSSVELPSADISDAVDQADAAAEQAFDAAEQAIDAIPDPAAAAQARAALERQQAQYAANRAQALATTATVNATVAQLERAVGSAVGATSAQLDLAVEAAQRTVDALTVRAPTAGIVTFGGGSGAAATDVSSLVSQLPSSLQGAASSALGGGGGGGGGTSSSTTIEQGVPVSSGQQLATVTDTSSLGLTSQVDETDILLVSKGIAADVQLDAVPDAVYRATVTSVGVTPTTSSRGGVSYVVRLRLGSGKDIDGRSAPKPRPGMSAVAQLKVRTSDDAVVVPASAVFRQDGRDQVWVVVEGKAQERIVRLGAEGSDTLAVVSGLTKGDTIVVRGADRVVAGQDIP
jgi:multidrug efflux pump subunit AcrA (membrane-fusion protein)